MSPEILVPIGIGVVALYFLSRFIRHGSLKGAMFGGRILQTHGEVHGTRRNFTNTTVKVHSIDSGTVTPDIALEFVSHSFASYEMTPFRLGRSEAKDLIRLLQQAVDHVAA